MTPQNIDTTAVKTYLLQLQDNITCSIRTLDSQANFHEDTWQHRPQGGGRTRVIQQGKIFEKAGINLSHICGDALPQPASAKRPELAGTFFEAMGISLVLHPDNPYVPTTHMNVRFFIAFPKKCAPIFWFGGGFDLTPYYPFDEDCSHWHTTALKACGDHALYQRYKAACDRYFYLPHRKETRGIGGLFFDDLNEWGFDRSFRFMRSIGDHFLTAYLPIVAKRHALPFGKREKDFQCYRRGRYVEFNLVHDRGTLFGLHSNGRTESILISLPPEVTWIYNYQPELDSAEAKLSHYLKPRTWI